MEEGIIVQKNESQNIVWDLVVVKRYVKPEEINEDYFETIDTEAKAYLLGFIIADGCIDDNKHLRLIFSNSIDDLKVLELAKKEISPKANIQFSNIQSKDVKFRKPQVKLRINSRKLCECLINKYKIIPRKTKDINFTFDFSLIPRELRRHFIRGFFDGDGCICFHKNRYKTIFFNFSFVFTSENFTKQIANLFASKFDIEPKISKIQSKNMYYFTLRFNYNRNRVKKIKEIYHQLYDNSNFFLERKKIKFEQYFEYRANFLSKQ